MQNSEFKKLLKASSEGKASVDGNLPGVAEKCKFERNRAKGPNQLSCKKRKPKPQPSAAQSQVIVTTQHYQLTSVRCMQYLEHAHVSIIVFTVKPAWRRLTC
uniref:UTP23 sensor motif region domain-containing protein n=1 Tax=Aegilops tauschii subsp. strangulata TaxID=200361 RepID=A0A453Q600_AEGTS